MDELRTVNGCIDVSLDAWLDERTDEWVKGWLDEWRQMDRWMNVFLTRFLEGWSEFLNQKSANFSVNGQINILGFVFHRWFSYTFLLLYLFLPQTFKTCKTHS